MRPRYSTVVYGGDVNNPDHPPSLAEETEFDDTRPEPPEPAATPAQRFLSKADRVADRLGAHLTNIEANYARLRGKEWTADQFAAHTDPISRRVLDLDKRLPVPPTECVGEEAALLLALQAAANAALQVTSGDEDELQAVLDRRETLHHGSFQASMRKARRHLDDYCTYRRRSGAVGDTD